MCTVSWFHEPGGYQLFCNRDERFSRATASEPLVRECRGVRSIAPRDGEAGGTWIAANEFGLSLCLLNTWGQAPPSAQSRGLVIPGLIHGRSVEEVSDRIGRSALPYAPFQLLALQPGRPALVMRWDGRSLQSAAHAEPCMLLSSSSFDPAGAERIRRRRLAGLIERIGSPKAGAFLALHRSHTPEPGPYSPCMHRGDRGTVSFSWLTVTRAEANLYYAPGPPCRSLAGSSCSLTRATEEAACLACS
jgi:hypothetical protein